MIEPGLHASAGCESRLRCRAGVTGSRRDAAMRGCLARGAAEVKKPG